MSSPRIAVFVIILLANGTGARADDLCAHGSAPTMQAAEEACRRAVEPAALEGMLRLYEAEQRPGEVAVTLPAYSEGHAGADLGFGLHVVKRFDADGATVFVNEHWPVIGNELLPPDEIRVQARVSHGHDSSRHTPGSVEDYAFARFRVGWEPNLTGETFAGLTLSGEALLAVEPQYQGNQRLPRRVPVSDLDCRGCHSVPAGADAEAIVQPGAFILPLDQMPGFESLAKTFVLKNYGREFTAALALPSMVPALTRALAPSGGVASLPFDSSTDSASSGVYVSGGVAYQDSLAQLIEQDGNADGWGLWWTDPVWYFSQP